MSLNSSSASQAPTPEPATVSTSLAPQESPQSPKMSRGRKFLYAIGLPVWVFLGFMLAQALVLAVIAVAQWAGVSFESMNASVFNVGASVVIYALAIAIVLGVPWLVKRRPTTKKDIGLHRLPSWMDIVWAPAGLVAYLILTAIITSLAMQFMTFIDFEQAQETGFTQIATQAEYILAFVSLVIVAPFAEEVLFRGYLLGKLRKYAPLWVAIIITSALFAAVHFQWNVAVDVFVLSIVLCLLRVVSKSLWPSILLHMMKNGIAFYFLFINPALLSTMGG